MDTNKEDQIIPPAPPHIISDRKLRTYKILLIVAILGLLVSVSILSLLLKKEKKQNELARQTESVTPTSIPTNPPILPATNYTLHSDSCSKSECLFNSPSQKGVLEGFAHLQGYYQQYTSTDISGYKTVCDSIVVTGGSEALIESLKQQVMTGNRINQLDAQNNLLVTLYIDNLTPREKNLLTTSNKLKPVDIAVIRKTPEGRETMSCEGIVDIVSVTGN